jgi:superfamily II DNA or RNA helicase
LWSNAWGLNHALAGAIHVFVAEKVDGFRLLKMLSSRYNCRFVSSDSNSHETNQVALKWSRGEFKVLISTSIALVGNENPSCKYLACAGYLYDSMQIVQALGRLRSYMRMLNWSSAFCCPGTFASISD